MLISDFTHERFWDRSLWKNQQSLFIKKKKNQYKFCVFRHFFFICDSLQEFQKKEKFIMLNMRIGNKNIVSGKYPVLTVTVVSTLTLCLWEVVWWTHSFLLWHLRMVKWLEEHFGVWKSWLQFYAAFFVTQAPLSTFILVLQGYWDRRLGLLRPCSRGD